MYIYIIQKCKGIHIAIICIMVIKYKQHKKQDCSSLFFQIIAFSQTCTMTKYGYDGIEHGRASNIFIASDLIPAATNRLCMP